MNSNTTKGNGNMGIARKLLGFGLALAIGLSSFGAKVSPLTCNQNDVIGDTPVVTNQTAWVGNLLGDGKYNPDTEVGRIALARDIINTFGAEDTSVKGRLAFKLTGVTASKTVTVSGITANGNYKIDWGDGTSEIVTNTTTLAGAMARASTSRSHRYPPEITEPVIDFPEGEITKIDGIGDGESATDTSFIHDENGNGLIKAVNVSEYEGPITWGLCAFARSPVEELNIPTNVTVGIGCFAMCHSLKRAKIDSPAISLAAFRGCSQLGDVTIGKHVQTIGERCFQSCSALSNVVFQTDSSLQTISSDVFSGCTALKHLDLPEGLKSFALGAGTGIDNITLPDSLEHLGNLFIGDAWKNVTYELPPNIKTLHATFAGWTNLQHITIPRSCKNIYSDTFDNCWNLTNVNFEAGCRIAQIGGYMGGNPESMGAFYECRSLKKIHIPLGGGVLVSGQSYPNNSIGTRAFDGCDALEEVTLDCMFENKYLNIGNIIFKDCPSLQKVIFTSEYAPASVGAYAFGSSLPAGFKISIPNGSSANYKTMARWSNYSSYYEERDLEDCKIRIKCPGENVINETIRLGPTYCEDTYLVDWGDGYVDEYESGNSPTHTYVFSDYNGRSGDKPAEICVKVRGAIKQIKGCKDGSGANVHTYMANGANNNADKAIKDIYIDAADSNIKIGDYCFKGCMLSNYSLGQYVTKVGNNCFQSSASLANLTFHTRGWLESIGDYSFSGCPLTSVTIPKSLYDIGAYAFYGCNSLRDVQYALNGNIENIGDFAFTTASDCYLTNIQIPNTVKTIGNSAFQNCKTAKSISLPQDGVLESIGNKAFYYALAVSGQLSIPKSVKTIGDEAFYGARAVTAYNLQPDGSLEYIGDKAFAYNTNHIDDIEIPASVKHIGTEAFSDYTYPPNITFASGSQLEYIGFLGDNANLGRVEFPNTLKYFGGYSSWVVDGEKYTPTMPEGIEYIGSLGHDDRPTNTTFNLPSSTKHLYMTLGGWDSLTSIIIPEGVTNIDYAAFSWCTALTNITFQNGCPNLEIIGKEAFEYCRSITSITIPTSLKKTGYCAFRNCSKLTSVTFPSGMTEIGASSFSGTALTEVNIPETVTAVGSDAFGDISTLTTVRIYATTPPVCKDYYGRERTDPLGSSIPSGCRIYVPSASLYTYKYNNAWKAYASKIYGM